MRWRNIVAAAIAGTLAIGVVFLAQRPRPETLQGALRTRTAQTIDLGDAATRRELELLMSRPRADADDLRSSLWKRCAEMEPDTFAVLASRVWVTDRYVEIRSNSGDQGATAYRWFGPRAPVQGPYRPRYQRFAERKLVSEAEYADLDAEFSALTAARLSPVRRIDAMDGGSVIIESCRGGQYALFVRTNAFDDDGDRRIEAFANRVLELAGIDWQKP